MAAPTMREERMVVMVPELSEVSEVEVEEGEEEMVVPDITACPWELLGGYGCPREEVRL